MLLRKKKKKDDFSENFTHTSHLKYAFSFLHRKEPAETIQTKHRTISAIHVIYPMR